MGTKAETPAKPRRRNVREKFPSTPDPVEIAMIAAASGKPLSDPARNVLEKHAMLIDRQAELAQAQCSELKLRRVGEGVRAALWAALAVAAFAIVALIAAVIVRAWRSDALIVQSFRVPPALEARGLSGEVVATQVLDKLAEMQERTNSVRAASTYANNWEDELKIDIPNTGASASEVWKLLRGWLGKETRISGEVIDAGPGLAVTARVGSSPGQRFQSAAGDLDALITNAADRVFRQTQPYRYAIYVGRTGREAERFAILRQLTMEDSPTERKWAYSGLSFDLNSRGEFKRSIAMARRALAIDGRMGPAMSNAAYGHVMLGHDQAAVDLFRRASALMDNAEYDRKAVASNRCMLQALIATRSRDPKFLDNAADCYETAAASNADVARVLRAHSGLLRHDPAMAMRLSGKLELGVATNLVGHDKALARLQGQMESGATPALGTALDEFRKAADLPASMGFIASSYRAAAPAQHWPVEAEALMMLGRTAEAQALIARTPRDCYNCVRVRGMVAQALGDEPAAQRWFAEAVRQGPRLPAAYVDWGRLLARHGRFAGAEAHFAKAAQLAPNWADPLKFWGDALAAQGKRHDALAKYDAALKLAPNWHELRRASARLRFSA